MKRGGTLGVLVGFALLAVAGVGFRLWRKADRAWLIPPPAGRWHFVVRVDGLGYDETRATLLALRIGRGLKGRMFDYEVGASQRPLRLWVAGFLTPKTGDDGEALLKGVRQAVAEGMSAKPHAWKAAWIDDQGRRVIVSGPGDR
jgi:hypothetical protein